eukprot:363973-Chlamydomonas_euryale.AAC.17
MPPAASSDLKDSGPGSRMVQIGSRKVQVPFLGWFIRIGPEIEALMFAWLQWPCMQGEGAGQLRQCEEVVHYTIGATHSLSNSLSNSVAARPRQRPTVTPRRRARGCRGSRK